MRFIRRYCPGLFTIRSQFVASISVTSGLSHLNPRRYASHNTGDISIGEICGTL